MRLKAKRVLLRAPFVVVVAGLTLLVGYRWVHQWPLSEREKAYQHSIQLWGTEPLVGHLVAQGEVQPSSYGPFRQYTFQFTDKFGQTENVSGDFRLSKPPSDEVKIWQQQSTGNVKLPGTFDPTYGVEAPTLPYYRGGTTQGWVTFVGLLGTLMVLLVLSFLASLIYKTVGGMVAEVWKDYQIKRQEHAKRSSVQEQAT